MKKIKIGFLPLYVKLYDDYAPSLRPRIDAFAKEISDLFRSKAGVELRTADVCRTESEFADAVGMFENESVDCIVTLHLAYSPSLESERVLKNTTLPIVVLDTTPNFAFTDDDDTAAISYNHGIHGVQDMCNLLIRNGKQFFIEAGHYTESDVIDRVIRRVKGIQAARSFQTAKVGTIGGAFAGMGDFTVAEDIFEKIGIESVALTCDDAKKYASEITEHEIDALIAEDKQKYIVSDDIPKDFLRNSVRGNLAVRKWIEDKKLSAFTANFLTIKSDFGIFGMPFAEANRAMERGIGYAGEGDVLTAALVGAFMQISDEASFVEMFCPDWKNNLIYLSHMGEMNTALTDEKAIFAVKPMRYSDIDATWLCGTYKAGAATLIDLAPLSDGQFRVIASFVEMKVPNEKKFRKKNTCGWFEPTTDISAFLENYSLLGGTHHLALIYGDMRKTAEAFAKTMGFAYNEI